MKELRCFGGKITIIPAANQQIRGASVSLSEIRTTNEYEWTRMNTDLDILEKTPV
jgi:hypothetical protein